MRLNKPGKAIMEMKNEIEKFFDQMHKENSKFKIQKFKIQLLIFES
jgi:hypothetical protein